VSPPGPSGLHARPAGLSRRASDNGARVGTAPSTPALPPRPPTRPQPSVGVPAVVVLVAVLHPARPHLDLLHAAVLVLRKGRGGGRLRGRLGGGGRRRAQVVNNLLDLRPLLGGDGLHTLLACAAGQRGGGGEGGSAGQQTGRSAEGSSWRGRWSAGAGCSCCSSSAGYCGGDSSSGGMDASTSPPAPALVCAPSAGRLARTRLGAQARLAHPAQQQLRGAVVHALAQVAGALAHAHDVLGRLQARVPRRRGGVGGERWRA